MRLLTCVEGSELFNATCRMHLHTQMLHQGELLLHPAQNTHQNPALLAQEVWWHPAGPREIPVTP